MDSLSSRETILLYQRVIGIADVTVPCVVSDARPTVAIRIGIERPELRNVVSALVVTALLSYLISSVGPRS